MESLTELQQQLRKAESELASISTDKHNPVKYDYEKGETYGEETHYNEYTDPARAHYLRERIARLNDKITNYNKYVEAEQKRAEYYQGKRDEAKQREITATAHDMYEQAQSDYNNKSVFGKIGAIFTGKKPKKLYDSDDIMKQYSEAAEQAINNESVDRKIAELEQQRQLYHAKFSGNTPRDEAQRATMDAHIDKEIAKLKGEDMSNGKSK